MHKRSKRTKGIILLASYLLAFLFRNLYKSLTIQNDLRVHIVLENIVSAFGGDKENKGKPI